MAGLLAAAARSPALAASFCTARFPLRRWLSYLLADVCGALANVLLCSPRLSLMEDGIYTHTHADRVVLRGLLDCAFRRRRLDAGQLSVGSAASDGLRPCKAQSSGNLGRRGRQRGRRSPPAANARCVRSVHSLLSSPTSHHHVERIPNTASALAEPSGSGIT